MDMWLVIVLACWLPVACTLALLVGRSVLLADRRDRQRRGLPEAGRVRRAPVVSAGGADVSSRRARRTGPVLDDHRPIAS